MAHSVSDMSRQMDVLAIGVAFLDSDGTIRSVNTPATDLMGAPREQLIGSHMTRWLTLEDGSLIPSSLLGCIDAIAPARPDLHLQLHIRRTVWEHPQPCYVVTLVDVTELRAAEESQRNAARRAEVSNRSKSRFLANMSHELRTPLNVIIGYSEYLHEDCEQDLTPELQLVLERVLGSARHLLALIGDLLDLSKIEAGKLELAHEPFDIERLVLDVAEHVRPLAVGHRNELVVEMGARLGVMVGDPRALRQCLLNLLSNAIKFTELGIITLTTRRRPSSMGDTLTFEVRDEGIGMSTEHVAVLFEEFTQAESSIQSRFGGTGLGLAITRRLCRMMGGDIRVESRISEGSKFTIVIPIRTTSHGGSTFASTVR